VRFDELERLGVALEAVEAVGTLEHVLAVALLREKGQRLVEFAQLQQASDLAGESVGIVGHELQDCVARLGGGANNWSEMMQHGRRFEN
jgi:hypothetical protein